jgi:hypothetical protein
VKKRLIVTCLAAVIFVGCAAATIASYLPIFETAVNGVVALVASQYASQVNTVEQAVNDFASAVVSVASDTTIQAKLSTVEAAAATLETDIGVSGNNDAKLAVAILDLSIGTYEAIIAKQAPPPTAAASAAFAPAAATTVKLAKPLSAYPTTAGGFKRQYNALCKQYGHSEMQQKLSMAERLHLK